MGNETLTLKGKRNDAPLTGGATVAVASKLPMDLVLQLFDPRMVHEPVMGGGSREVKIFEPRRGSKKFVVMGNSFPQNKAPHQQLAGGFAITHGIPKEFWDEWLDKNAEADYVVNGMIFAHEDARSTTAEATEKQHEKSGLERLDPQNLPKGLQTSDMQRV